MAEPDLTTRTAISSAFGVAELLVDVIALVDSPDVIATAWHGAIASPSVSVVDDAFLTMLLKRVVDDLEASGRLDTGDGESPTTPAEFYPEGHRWEDWRADDPVDFSDTKPSRADVVAALRHLPAVMRVLLVLRDGAHLSSEETARIVSGTTDEQARLLHAARDAFVAALGLVRDDRAR